MAVFSPLAMKYFANCATTGVLPTPPVVRFPMETTNASTFLGFIIFESYNLFLNPLASA